MKFKLAAAAVLAAFSTTASAATIGFGFNAGPVIEIDDPNNSGAFAGFIVGEDLFVEFAIESTTADSRAAAGSSSFFDASGRITVRGLTTGTTLVMNPGVEIQFDDNTEFELDSGTIPYDDTEDGYFLDGDIDLVQLPQLVSDPDNLSLSITELEAKLVNDIFRGFLNGTDNRALIVFFIAGDGKRFEEASLGFGPVPTDLTPVPIPAAAPLMLAGLGAIAMLRRRCKADNRGAIVS